MFDSIGDLAQLTAGQVASTALQLNLLGLPIPLEAVASLTDAIIGTGQTTGSLATEGFGSLAGLSLSVASLTLPQ